MEQLFAVRLLVRMNLSPLRAFARGHNIPVMSETNVVLYEACARTGVANVFAPGHPFSTFPSLSGHVINSVMSAMLKGTPLKDRGRINLPFAQLTE